VPIYEYRCQDCARTFEVLTTYAARERAQACPTCESTQTSVQVSNFAAIGAIEPAHDTAVPRTGGCCGGSCGCGH
jgi:putative FmdB family regulatory protein